MALGKTAIGLTMAGALALSAAQFPVRHQHLRKVLTPCSGMLRVDVDGVTFTGSGKHRWTWKYSDIQRLTLSPKSISILTYEGSLSRLGADRSYEFTGEIPAAELYTTLKDRMDQRLVAELGEPAGPAQWAAAAKHLRGLAGSQGRLAAGAQAIVYGTPAAGDSRTWRYSDISNISSSGPFQLTIVTLAEVYNFQLKEPLTEAGYNRIWLTIEKNTGESNEKDACTFGRIGSADVWRAVHRHHHRRHVLEGRP
jgi:hypothetical protein